MNPIRIAAGAGASLIALMTIWGCFYTIDQGEVGVILQYGAVKDTAGPGLHFKMPFVQSLEVITTQIQKDAFEKHGDEDRRMDVYTADQQPVKVALSVNYHVTNPVEVYSQFRDIEGMTTRVIDPRSNEQVKNIFGQFTAQQAIQNRAKLNAEVFSAIRSAMVGPVVVDSVQIEDISFSDSFEKAVEARMQATVRQQQAESEKAKRMIDADAQKYEREAQADAALYTAQAEAKGIQAKGEALRTSPEVVSLTYAQAALRWDGKLPQQMVPGGAVPFINMGK